MLTLLQISVARRHILFGFAATAVLILAAWAMLPRAATGADAEYSFSDIAVKHAVDPRSGEVDTSRAVVSYTVSWTTDAFPGRYDCVWIVESPGGGVAGIFRDHLISLQPSAHGAIEVPISGVPVDARISCAETRNDASGHYEVTNVRLQSTTPPDEVPDHAAVNFTFDARWTGPDAVESSAATCTVSVIGESGSRLHQEDITLLIAEGHGRGLRGRLPLPPDGLEQEPASVEMVCRPFDP